MNIERYAFLRNDLIRLYRLFSERTFLVYVSPASFLTLEQLERARERPPLTGFETLELSIERPYTVEYLLRGVEIMGSEFKLGFQNPRQDIPVIFESIQTWISHWLEIKVGAGYLRTPSIQELEIIEQLGRYLFTPYSHYYHERINKDMNINPNEELTLVQILKGTMMHGKDFGEPISYYSQLDHYKAEMGYSDTVVNTAGTFDFLKGFGGGL